MTDSILRRHRKVVVNGEFVTESIDLAIPRPQAIMDFFEAFSKIDVHDNIRQGILEMEKNLDDQTLVFTNISNCVRGDCRQLLSGF